MGELDYIYITNVIVVLNGKRKIINTCILTTKDSLNYWRLKYWNKFSKQTNEGIESPVIYFIYQQKFI